VSALSFISRPPLGLASLGLASSQKIRTGVAM